MSKATIAQAIDEQLDWINENGRTRAGYVEHYGSKNDPEHHGDGGEAIHAADMAELAKLRDRLGALGDAPTAR